MVVFPWRLMIIISQKFYESEQTKKFNRLIDPRICYILNHLHHQHFLCILRGNNFQEIEHQIFPLKLVFIFQKVYYFFWRHNGSTLFVVLSWVVPPPISICRRVSLTYYLQTTAVSFACGNLAGVWHFQTADSSFVSSDFSFITFPYQSLVHFCVKKEWEVRGSENWKWCWIFMFDHVKLWLTAGPLTLTSSTIYPHSADITLSFMLNYGVNRFQVSSYSTFLKFVAFG